MTSNDVGKVCLECGAPRPKGRTKFCSDACLGAVTQRRTRARDDTRLTPCRRCGGSKETGIRGGRYCAECRRIMADAFQQHEHERGRRRNIEAIQTKLADGDRVKSQVANAPEGMKWCARCQEFRPVTSFTLRKSGRRAPYCQPCQRGYNRERRLLLMFGLTWEEYDFLLAAQDYRCAICDCRPRRNMLAVDHDHSTGEIRGLLCSRCNQRLLGAANDNPARLRKAADYLEAFTPREVFGSSKFVPGTEITEAVS
jgi:hypothetical protein